MEAHPVTHPSADVLRAFALSQGDDPSASVLLNHLDGCPDCRKVVEALCGEDFLVRFRQARGREATTSGQTMAESVANAPPPQGPTTLLNLPPELADHPDYEVLRELGRGGMGVVYLAKHRLSGRMEVLKVMNKALIGKADSRERFLREIQSAAKLDHKNVVKMYTALERGELIVLVMEYVEGEDLAQWIKSRGALPVLNACYYVQQAALGLQHAHEKGMVHRDIKPQNLILSREGRRHVVKILDFGLAKAMSKEESDARLTRLGTMMGTPGYVAPEQSLDAATADIRADVYSLGCTLYHLLAGTPPFSGKSVSEIVQAHHAVQARPLNVVRPEVTGDLAAVVARMMAKNVAHRYQTPAEVARALEPFVKGVLKPLTPLPDADKAAPLEVVHAEKTGDSRVQAVKDAAKSAPPTPAPSTTDKRAGGSSPLLLQKTILAGGRPPSADKPANEPRSRKPLIVALAILLMLAGLGVASIVLVWWLVRSDGILVVEINEPNAQVYVDDVPATADWTDDGRKAEIRVRPGTRKIEVRKNGFAVFAEEVEVRKGKRRVLTAQLLPDTAGSYDRTGGYRFVHFDRGKTRVLPTSAGKGDGFARVYDVESGKAVAPPLRDESSMRGAWFSPDGQRVVTVSYGKTARLWDAGSGKEVTPPLKHAGGVLHASFSADGQRLVTVSEDRTARLWNAVTGKAITPLMMHDSSVTHASFSPDGRRIVTVNGEAARLWDTSTCKEAGPPLKHAGSVKHAAFSPDGRYVVTAGSDAAARLWDASTGKEITPPLKHEAAVLYAAFSCDGRHVVTASEDRTARTWDAATGTEITSALKHESSVLHASFSADGKRLVTVGSDRKARLWNTATGKEVTPPLTSEYYLRYASFSPDGQRIVTLGSGTVQLWDAATGEELKKVTISSN